MYTCSNMIPQWLSKFAYKQFPPEIECVAQEIVTVGVVTEKIFKSYEESDKILKKSVKRSDEARKAGNDLYVEKGHDMHIHKDILNQYSRSIAFAPKDSKELVLGYSNRSIFLMHIHRYEESLVDIDRALLLSKDDVFKTKLQARKENCLGLLNEQNLIKSSQNLTLGDNKDLDRLALKLKKNFKPSSTVPCASDAVGLGCNGTFGRHLVATRNIKSGEILIVEEGYACYPLLSEIHYVCSHCLQIAWNGIPCDECVYAIFCSEDCKNEAYNEYHDIECPIVEYIWCTVLRTEKETWDRLTSIRLIIKALRKEGFENIMKEISKKRNEEKLDGLLFNGILPSDKFRSCYNLLPHEQVYKKEKETYESGSLIILYLLLEHTNFLDLFVTNNPVGENAVNLNNCLDPFILLKFKEVLTTLKYVIATNQYLFELTHWHCGCDFEKKPCYRIRGIVVVPSCALINHSCTYNVSHLSMPKRKIMIFSTRPIKKGEMLCDSYGPSIISGDLKTRQNMLKHLPFTCQCKACLDNIDVTKIANDCGNDYPKIMDKLQRNNYPRALTDLYFEKSIINYEMSEEVLKYQIEMSEFYFENFNHYKAFLHNGKGQFYIEKMMCKLFEEKKRIPNACQTNIGK